MPILNLFKALIKLSLQRQGRPGGRAGFGDFAALDAACADADPLGCAVDQGLYGLEIHVPAPTGYVVRVRDVVTELRAFAANIAYLCHRSTPNPCVLYGRLNWLGRILTHQTRLAESPV